MLSRNQVGLLWKNKLLYLKMNIQMMIFKNQTRIGVNATKSAVNFQEIVTKTVSCIENALNPRLKTVT